MYLKDPESQEEAQSLLTVAHAGRNASHAEKLFVESKIHEAITLLQLYRIRAHRCERQLKEATVDVGRAHLAIRQSGYQLEPLVTHSDKRSDTTYHIMSSYQLLFN